MSKICGDEFAVARRVCRKVPLTPFQTDSTANDWVDMSCDLSFTVIGTEMTPNWSSDKPGMAWIFAT